MGMMTARTDRTMNHCWRGAPLVSLLLAGTFLVCSGCGYTTRGLYPQNVRTVAVPIFTSDGLRRDLEFPLTERVMQSIESQTPFKVVDSGDADTLLRGRITSFFKSPYGEDAFDNPRGGVMNVTVQVTWIDNTTGNVIAEGTINAPQSLTLQAIGAFAIDTAQSNATADQIAIENIADQIVTLMQNPW
ncbi:hypothetical protein Pan216_40580 [Planctomycetes bacterium Pan216]|uniref:Lipopolysaccharide-assembly n=1 Tax=Kolteria novifilia TaxID=2527975 RepID=A0A518B899_9BACT|nr:hypothetical protein Pan216_40580 [Planctomycetes bacterium Pan216]